MSKTDQLLSLIENLTKSQPFQNVLERVFPTDQIVWEKGWKEQPSGYHMYVIDEHSLPVPDFTEACGGCYDDTYHWRCSEDEIIYLFVRRGTNNLDDYPAMLTGAGANMDHFEYLGWPPTLDRIVGWLELYLDAKKAGLHVDDQKRDPRLVRQDNTNWSAARHWYFPNSKTNQVF